MGIWSSPISEGDTFLSSPSPLRLLLVGPRRTGKSSTGNTLLGRGQVFDTQGGGASTTANGVAAGRHVTVTDAQGWGSSEDSVPRSEKKELLRALSLCEPGPHAILLVIPLLDFTESERRSVERRMELLTHGAWRHTLVLFTFGDSLRHGKGTSVEEHVRQQGPALHWLMDKCRYRYLVLDNKMATTVTEARREAGVRKGKERGRWGWRKGPGTDTAKGGRDGELEGETLRGRGQEQVREVMSRLEDMLQENGGWHFSLHMYHRLEEEWNRREQELSARMGREKKGRLDIEEGTEEGWNSEEESTEQLISMGGEIEEEAKEVEVDTQSSTEKDSDEKEREGGEIGYHNSGHILLWWRSKDGL